MPFENTEERRRAMVYCPECGNENAVQASFCSRCGKSLPQSNVQQVFCPQCGAPNRADAFTCAHCQAVLLKAEGKDTSPPPFASTPSPVFSNQALPPLSPWQNLRPDIRSAIITFAVVSGLQALTDAVPGLGFTLTAPFAIIAYYVQGIITGRLIKSDPRYREAAPGKYAQLGAMSGFWTSAVISTLLTLIVVALMGTVTVGTFVAAIPVILGLSILDILLNIGFSALGAWLYGRSGGKGVLGISIGVVTCGIVFVCLLSVLILAGLTALGISVYQGFTN